MNPKVDAFISRAKNWQVETEQLRMMALDCQLTEELKWGKPSYSYQNSNIVLIQGFKDYCALLFFKGALLQDAKGLLFRMGENTQAARQLRFTDVKDIKKIEPIIKAYIFEAIEVEKAGLKVPLIKNDELVFPEEFIIKLSENPDLKTAFTSLTPGRQRAYNMFFTAPKQSRTRESRIGKCMPQILAGKGLND